MAGLGIAGGGASPQCVCCDEQSSAKTNGLPLGVIDRRDADAHQSATVTPTCQLAASPESRETGAQWRSELGEQFASHGDGKMELFDYIEVSTTAASAFDARADSPAAFERRATQAA
jgi:hypothetical protein